MTRKNAFRSVVLLAAAGVSLTLTNAADARGIAHVGNGARGATAVAGQNGAAGNIHTTTHNADGSTTVTSAGGFVGTNGSRGQHQTTTTVGADGSVSRSGSASTSGANGSAQTSGGFTRSANGTWSGSRSTSATNAKTGNSYNGSTTIDPTTGKPVHTGTCTNASGATIAC